MICSRFNRIKCWSFLSDVYVQTAFKTQASQFVCSAFFFLLFRVFDPKKVSLKVFLGGFSLLTVLASMKKNFE